MQDKILLKNANVLRNEPTPFEKLMWAHLSRSQLGGYKFRRQHVVEDRVVDFFCPGKRLIVEIDGDTHDPDKDAIRDRDLMFLGFEVLRFSNHDVGTNLEGVLSKILLMLQSLPDRWSLADAPTPTPPLKGRGF